LLVESYRSFATRKSSCVFWELLLAWRSVLLTRKDDAAVIREQIVDLAKQVVLIH